MDGSNVFKYVVKLTEARFGNKGGLSELDYLFGYAQLILMDEGILNEIFKDEADQKELQEIKAIFAKTGIDPKLLKTGAPLIHDSEDVDKRVKADESLISGGKSASVILQKLIDGNVPNLDVMQKGNSISNVIDRATKLAKEREQKSSQKSSEKESKEEKKPSKAAPKEAADKAEKEISADEKQQAEAEEKEETPVDKPDEYISLTRKTSHLYECLKSKIFGQDEAIRLFTEGYFQSEIFSAKSAERKGPSATFLFAGPPGVGKTYLASSVADILGMEFKRFDMSEYSMNESGQQLIGTQKVYKGAEAGKLTSFVEEHPYSIILIDEVEKAHISVIYLFLQILDGGILTDAYTERKVSFNNTMIIFTTNVGKKLYEDPSKTKLANIPRSIIMKEIEAEVDEYNRPRFPGAICSRFASGNVVMFNRLEVHNFVDIINAKFDENAGNVSDIYGYDMDIDKCVAPMLLFSQSSRSDARTMSSQSTILIKNELYELGRNALDREDELKAIEKINLKVDLEKEDESIKKLCVNEDTAVILFIGNPADLESVPKSKKFRFEISDKDNVLEDIAEKDISFVLIDMLYDSADNDDGFLSLDDIKSDAVISFDLISQKFPNMPVYMTDERDLKPEDVNIFLEKGIREFIRWQDDGEFADRLSQISDMVYMQARVDELSGRGRVLTYNSAQRLNGKEADITFYDFKVQIAVDADEGKMLLSDNDKPTDRFSDVIGAENAKKELQYFVDYLKNPKKFMAKSVKLPNGILLYGPPGTGKTMLARAMAGECDVSFFPTTGTSFLNKYVGESEENVRRLFATAKKFAPSIIFIDEIDAIGKPRTGEPQSEHTEKVLNTLLTEMQGFTVDPNRPVFVVAATNFSVNGSAGVGAGLDEALLRRFDNKIEVDLPNTEEREKYLNILLADANITTVSSNAVHNIASRTTGESLGILKNVVDLAIRNSIRDDKELDDKMLLDALEDYMYGEKKEWNDEYYETVAIHESGHAYVYWRSGKKPSFMTIVSRGDFGGYMQHADPEKTPSYTKEDMLWRIRVSLAGRAAEELFFKEKGISTGIGSDIQNATQTALRMLYSYAMSDNGLAAVPYNQILNSPLCVDALKQANEVLDREMAETKKIVEEGKDTIRKLADYLKANNQATEKEILAIFEGE